VFSAEEGFETQIKGRGAGRPEKDDSIIGERIPILRIREGDCDGNDFLREGRRRRCSGTGNLVATRFTARGLGDLG
jgi:hypothetical protein